jgi:hypothetical protein
MANVIPRFDMSSMTLKDDTELATALKGAASAGDRFFKPGMHEVTVLSSTFEGLVASDPTWGKYKVELEGAGGKLIKDWINVPFKDLMSYNDKNGKNSVGPGKRIKLFLEALGATVTIKTLGDTLKTYFSKDNALVGLNVTIEVAYRKNYVKYMGKSGTGENQLRLVTPKDEVIEGTPVFASYADAHDFAASHNIAVTKYVDVVGYKASSTPNARPKTEW